nr:hypothetical protein [Mycobacterium palustre]
MLGIVVDVLDFELNHLTDGLLLSQECDRLVERRPILGRVLIIGGAAVIAGHLANVIPERYDVMAQRFWQRTKEKQSPTQRGK